MLFWNVRGINKLNKQNEVKKLISHQKIGFVGLLETKVKAHRMGALYLNMFQGWCFTSNIAHHPNGGIIIAWNSNSFEVDIRGGSSQCIHCWIRLKRGDQFVVTVVYALNENNGRQQLWNDLGAMAQDNKLLWLVCGDFNTVLNTAERFEYHGNGTKMVPFQIVVLKMLKKFPTAEVTFLPKGVFDHTLAILSIYPNFQDTKKPFRYFNYWSSLKTFSGIVQSGWQENVEGFPMYKLVSKLRHLKRGLKGLKQQGVGDISVQDSEAYKTLIAIQLALREQLGNGDLITREIQARKRYAEIHKNYLIFLRQKAKIT
ncbi:uncharacterized protein LOC133823045 [Humulus lupulus]|uniref:uncharacterized protein LOC133823045 n=1 Tax=Humulus lupulus TaxID=3486 RepID=UPI002B4018A3|nr:uncharacterized protein LOC133823045 [Humulus lupulus]